MSRIELPVPETMTARQREVYDKIVGGRRGRIAGPLRAALLNPELADCWQALGELLRYSTSLPPRLSEMAILVTAEYCQSSMEWLAHQIAAEQAGVEKAIIEDLQAGRKIIGDSDDALICAFAAELNRFKSVSDETYDRALERFGDVALVELTALVGYYTLVAMTVNAHEIPLPADMAHLEGPFPLPHRVLTAKLGTSTECA